MECKYFMDWMEMSVRYINKDNVDQWTYVGSESGVGVLQTTRDLVLLDDGLHLVDQVHYRLKTNEYTITQSSFLWYYERDFAVHCHFVKIIAIFAHYTLFDTTFFR